MSEQCERTSERTREWPSAVLTSRFMAVLNHSGMMNRVYKNDYSHDTGILIDCLLRTVAMNTWTRPNSPNSFLLLSLKYGVDQKKSLR